MRHAFAALLAALLVLPTIASAESIGERNADFLWSLVGDADPATEVTFADGRVMTLAAAVDDAVARAGPVDLAALTSGAAVPAGLYVGDVWIIGFGFGGCGATQIAPGSPLFVPVDPQAWVYSGGIGTMSGDGFYYIVGWTTKNAGVHTHYDAVGNTDFYCFSWGGGHFAFPFINGVVQGM